MAMNNKTYVHYNYRNNNYIEMTIINTLINKIVYVISVQRVVLLH